MMKFAKASKAKPKVKLLNNTISRIPPIKERIPILKTTIDPIKAALLIDMFFSYAKSTSAQVFLLKFLMLIIRRSKEITQLAPQAIGVK